MTLFPGKEVESGHKFDRTEQYSQHLEPPYRRFGPNRCIGQRLRPLDRHWERRGLSWHCRSDLPERNCPIYQRYLGRKRRQKGRLSPPSRGNAQAQLRNSQF